MEYSVPDSLQKSDPAYVRYEQISPIWEFIEITSFQNSTRIPLLQEVFHDFPIRGHCCLLILLFCSSLFLSYSCSRDIFLWLPRAFAKNSIRAFLSRYCICRPVTQLPPRFRLSPEGQSYNFLTFVSLANHYLFNSE